MATTSPVTVTNNETASSSWIPSISLPNPFNGRCFENWSCLPSWKDAAMATGTAVAVAGAVASFAIAAYATGAAFVIVAAVTAYASSYVRNFPALEANVAQLTQDNKDLLAAQVKTEETVGRLKGTVDEQKANLAEAEIANTNLKNTLRSAKTQTAQYTTENEKLKTTINTNAETTKALELELGGLRRLIQEVSKKAAEFNQENAKLIHETNGLSIDLAAIDKENAVLASDVKGVSLQKDLHALSLSIHQSQSVLKILLQTQKDQVAAIQAEIVKLKSAQEAVTADSTTLQERTEKLALMDADLNQKTVDLQNLVQQIATAKAAIDAEQEKFLLVTAQLEEKTALNAVTEKALEKTIAQLKEVEAKFAEANRNHEELARTAAENLGIITGKVTEKTAELEKINTQITQKLVPNQIIVEQKKLAALQDDIEEKSKALADLNIKIELKKKLADVNSQEETTTTNV